jgi:hypothetical protein
VSQKPYEGAAEPPMPNEHIEALSEPVIEQNDLVAENRQLREAIIMARAEIIFALCFKEFEPVRHMLESVIATLSHAIRENQK